MCHLLWIVLKGISFLLQGEENKEHLGKKEINILLTFHDIGLNSKLCTVFLE